jgi:hypothetical protein
MQVGRAIHKACNSVKAGMAPDEFILLTALRAHGYARSIQRVEMKPGMRYPPGTLLNSYPTLVLFPAESSPHPVLWTDMDTKKECQVRLVLHTRWRKMLLPAYCLSGLRGKEGTHVVLLLNLHNWASLHRAVLQQRTQQAVCSVSIA